MIKKILAILGLAIALGLLTTVAPVLAQEDQTDQDQVTRKEQNEQQASKSEAKDQAGAEQSEGKESGEEDLAPDRQKTLNGFVPSEQISEDLSVSFPVDI